MADLKKPVQGAGKLEKVNSRPHVLLVQMDTLGFGQLCAQRKR